MEQQAREQAFISALTTEQVVLQAARIAGSTVPRIVKTADYRPRWRAQALC
jgi:hypothetical protein